MIERFAIAALPATPWKNGGGNTREVLCRPPGSNWESFDWRVSIASITQSGPFSVFPGVERTIVLLSGAGLLLRSEGIEQRLDQIDQPYTFSGDAASDCTLLQGETSDFNVMTRRGRAHSSVLLHTDRSAVPAAQGGVLLATQGSWHVCSEPNPPADTTALVDLQPTTPKSDRLLASGQGLWWDGPALAWQLHPQQSQARLLSVRIALFAT